MDMDDLADYVKEEMPINIFYGVSESIVGINEDPQWKSRIEKPVSAGVY